MKGYWMYTSDVDKVFKNRNKAENYQQNLIKIPECHAYIVERNIEK